MSTDLEPTILSITEFTDAESLAVTIDRLDSYIRRGRELKALLDEQLMEWIRANGDLEIGSVRYYLGTKKETVCIARGETLNKVLELAGGDLDAAVRDYIGSNPFKHGAIRKAMESKGMDGFDKLFAVEERAELKEGKPVKSLQRIDTRFIK